MYKKADIKKTCAVRVLIPAAGVLAGVHICISVGRPEQSEHSCDDRRFDQV